MKILIVDDLASNRALLDKIVRSNLSYDTILAADGSEALTKVALDKPDLILLDVMMPVMNGHSFLKELRSRDQWKGIPVVVTTSSGEKAIVKEMVALGVSGYLLRPFAARQVVAAVQEAMKSAGIGGEKPGHPVETAPT
ncbi:MAG: response regulator [Ignavibacteriales bacterium]|nr:response regulator [Ignavibacteriales bacterium]